MGWTVSPNDKPVKEFLTKELEPHRVVGYSRNNGAAYIALDVGDRVLGLVVLVDHRPGRTGYKLISEDMGPIYYNCPEKILNLLTEPAPNEWAEKWRSRCRLNLNPGSDVPVSAYAYADGLSHSD